MLHGCSRPGTRTTTTHFNSPTGQPDSLQHGLRSRTNFQGHSPEQDVENSRAYVLGYGQVLSREHSPTVLFTCRPRRVIDG